MIFWFSHVKPPWTLQGFPSLPCLMTPEGISQSTDPNQYPKIIPLILSPWFSAFISRSIMVNLWIKIIFCCLDGYFPFTAKTPKGYFLPIQWWYERRYLVIQKKSSPSPCQPMAGPMAGPIPVQQPTMAHGLYSINSACVKACQVLVRVRLERLSSAREAELLEEPGKPWKNLGKTIMRIEGEFSNYCKNYSLVD